MPDSAKMRKIGGTQAQWWIPTQFPCISGTAQRSVPVLAEAIICALPPWEGLNGCERCTSWRPSGRWSWWPLGLSEEPPHKGSAGPARERSTPAVNLQTVGHDLRTESERSRFAIHSQCCPGPGCEAWPTWPSCWRSWWKTEISSSAATRGCAARDWPVLSGCRKPPVPGLWCQEEGPSYMENMNRDLQIHFEEKKQTHQSWKKNAYWYAKVSMAAGKESSPLSQTLQAHHHAQFVLHGQDVGGQLGQVAQRLRTEEQAIGNQITCLFEFVKCIMLKWI